MPSPLWERVRVRGKLWMYERCCPLIRRRLPSEYGRKVQALSPLIRPSATFSLKGEGTQLRERVKEKY